MTDDELASSRNMLESYKKNKFVHLEWYANDVEGFFPYIQELKHSIFKFRDEDMKIAKAIFQTMGNTFRATKRPSLRGKITMISIHIRLTDYSEHLKVLYHMEVISNAFLTKAMTYCTRKYQVRVSYST